MGRETSRLRHSDLRSIYLLIGECCELGADPLVWRMHMLTRLNELLGASASVFIQANLIPAADGSGIRTQMAVSVDQYTLAERQIITDCVKSIRLEDNPLMTKLVEQALTSGPVARARRELVSDGSWERCRIVTDFFSRVQWFDMVGVVVPSITTFQNMNFARDRNDPSFGKRQARILETFVRELTQISEVRLAGLEETALRSLPEREREVLLALAQGDDEKQIGARLGISRNTVHEYVRRLFKRYGVNSRSELLVKSVRQIHAHQMAASQQLNPLYYRREG